jgi:uncharacterized protein (DUF2336 family)
MRDILSRLKPDVEVEVRIAIAEKIATDPNAPLDLVLFLADDNSAAAQPIVLRSQLLSDEELLKFIARADVAQQAFCAGRPNISELVADALARSNAEPVLTVLVRNVSAKIGTKAFAMLAEKSKSIAGLQEPLAQRTDLPRPVAIRMHEWVSDSVRDYLAKRYQVSSDAPQYDSRNIDNDPSGDIFEKSYKLIGKLAAAEQLKPGFLLRVLQQGQLDLFELAFARLLQLDHTQMRRVLYEVGPRPVAMACRAVGIDRCVFPTVYNLSRQARRVLPLLRPDDRLDTDVVFNSYSKTEALARVQVC